MSLFRTLHVAARGAGPVILMSIATTAGAQEPSRADEEALFARVPTVTAASRYVQDIRDAPASVTIITSEEIERFGYRNLGEVLARVRGFYSTYDRNYQYLGVRGWNRTGDYNTHVLLLVDGHRINEAAGDGFVLGDGALVDLRDVQRVEVVRGPSSSLYGTNAFLGVVNVITRSGRWMDGGEVSLEARSYRSGGGRAAFGRRTAGGVEYTVSASTVRSRGQDFYYPEFDQPDNNNGRALGVDGSLTDRLLARLSAGNFSFAGAFAEYHKDIPTGSFETVFNDKRNSTRDWRAFARATYGRDFGNGSQLTVAASFDWKRYEGDYMYEVFNTEFTNARSAALEAHYIFSIGRRQRFAIGVEGRDSYNVRLGVEEVDPDAVLLDERLDAHAFGAFVQDEIRLTRHAVVQLGARYDRFDLVGDAVSPRGALVLRPSEQTTVKIVYGSAFRAPSLNELFYSDGDVTWKKAAGLRPEGVRSVEVAVDRGLGTWGSLSMSLYRTRITGLISLVTDPIDDLLVFENIDAMTSRGFEIEGRAEIARRVQIQGAIAVQRSTNEETGAEITNSPRWLGRLGGSVDLVPHRLTLAGEFNSISRRQSARGVWVAGRSLLNVVTTARLASDRVSAQFGLYNALNTSYGDPGGEEHEQDALAQDLRNVRAGLTFRF